MKPIQLSEEVGMYIDRLRSEFDAIEEVWLIGARANDSATRSSVWELVVFADERLLNILRKQQHAWERPDVSLLVVVDGDRFEKLSDPSGQGRLSAMGWTSDDAESATYRGAEDGSTVVLNAVRVR